MAKKDFDCTFSYFSVGLSVCYFIVLVWVARYILVLSRQPKRKAQKVVRDRLYTTPITTEARDTLSAFRCLPLR